MSGVRRNEYWNIDEVALDTEFNLTPGRCVWQDQVIFFNMAHATMKFNFELEEGFTDEKENRRECDPWNTLCTTKLKEVVASAWMTFKWQSSKEGERLKDCTFKEGLSSRPVALRLIYWEISSDNYVHPLQNGVWGWGKLRDVWSAPLRGTGRGLVRQRWQGSAVTTWKQSAEGSESDEILRQCLVNWLKKRKGAVTIYTPDNRHIHKHSFIHTYRLRHTAAH